MVDLKKGEFVIILLVVLIVSMALSFFIINFSHETQVHKVVTTTGGSYGLNPVGTASTVNPCECL